MLVRRFCQSPNTAMARTRGGACSVRPSAGPRTMPLPRLAVCDCLTRVTHFLWKTWQGHCGPIPPATSLHFLCRTGHIPETPPRRARPSAAARRGCLRGDTGGAGPASLLGVPRAHSPRVRIPAASWGPATGVSRRGVQAGSSGHVSHHPHSQRVCAAPQIYLVQVPPSSWQGD